LAGVANSAEIASNALGLSGTPSITVDTVNANLLIGPLAGVANAAVVASNALGLSGTPSITVDTVNANLLIGPLAGVANAAVVASNALGLSGTPSITVGDVIVNGNIGVGTTLPVKKLDVQGDINFSGDLYKNNVIFSGASQWTTSGTSIYYTTGNVGIGTSVARSSLDVVGNAIISTGLGIGTTTPGAYALNVQGTSYMNNSLEVATTVSASSFVGSLAGIANSAEIASNALGLSGTPSITVANLTASSGTISGTLTTSNLTVLGSNTTVNTYTMATSNVSICNISGDGPALSVYQKGIGLNYPIADFYDVDVSTTIPAFRIADGGNIGIGVTQPQYSLDVNGSIQASNYFGNASGLCNITGQLMYITGGGLRVANQKLVVDGDLFLGGQIFGGCNTSVFTGGATMPALISPNVVTSSNIVDGSITFPKLDPSAYNFQWMAITGGGLRTSQKVVIDSDLIIAGNIYNASNQDLNSLYPGGAILGCNIGVGVINTSNLVDRSVTIPKIDFTSNLPVVFGGNIGIGTTTLLQTFHVQGVSYHSSSIGIGTTLPRQFMDIQGGNAIISGSVGIGTTLPRQFMDIQGGNAIISGNVGIGTTNPANLLSLGTGGAAFPSPSGSAPLYAIRAWANINGSSGASPVERANFNLTGTRNSSGLYTFTLTTPAPAGAFISAFALAGNVGTTNFRCSSIVGIGTTSFQVQTKDQNNNVADCDNVLAMCIF
jgi:hypothetical protein